MGCVSSADSNTAVPTISPHAATPMPQPPACLFDWDVAQAAIAASGASEQALLAAAASAARARGSQWGGGTSPGVSSRQRGGGGGSDDEDVEDDEGEGRSSATAAGEWVFLNQMVCWNAQIDRWMDG
jgi:hypothetical protein